MARRVRISAIDQAILNAQEELAQIDAEFGNTVAQAVADLIGLEKDLETIGPISSYKRHLADSLRQALIVFADADPTNVEIVRRTQATIRQYADLLSWIAQTTAVGTGQRLHMEAMVPDGAEPSSD